MRYSKTHEIPKRLYFLLFSLVAVLSAIVTSGCGCGCTPGTTPDYISARAPLVVGPGMAYSTPQEAVDACRDGDTILIMDGTYTFEKGIELFEKNNIKIIGRDNVELVCTNMDDNVMWIVTCSNITIKNIKARHTDPTKDERCYGNVFAIDTSRIITIENCDINGCGAIGVYSMGGSKIMLRQNHIHNNSLWAVQHNGVGYLQAVDNMDDLYFEDNIIENNGPPTFL